MIQDVDQVTPSQIRRRQRWNVHLFVQPFLAFARSNFSPGNARQFPGLASEHFTPTQVLYCFGERRLGRLHRHLLIRVFKETFRTFLSCCLKLLKISKLHSLATLITVYTLLRLLTVAEIPIVSPGTYPPRSRLTLQNTGPPDTQETPTRCSISCLAGCCSLRKFYYYVDFFNKPNFSRPIRH